MDQEEEEEEESEENEEDEEEWGEEEVELEIPETRPELMLTLPFGMGGESETQMPSLSQRGGMRPGWPRVPAQRDPPKRRIRLTHPVFVRGRGSRGFLKDEAQQERTAEKNKGSKGKQGKGQAKGQTKKHRNFKGVADEAGQ